MANLDVFENEGILENVRENEPRLRAMLESLRDIQIVGDVRGAGYFQAIELVKDRETRQSFSRRGVRGPPARLPLAASCTAAGSSAAPTTAATRSSSSPRRSSPARSSSTEIESILRPVLEEAAQRMLHAG